MKRRRGRHVNFLLYQTARTLFLEMNAFFKRLGSFGSEPPPNDVSDPAAPTNPTTSQAKNEGVATLLAAATADEAGDHERAVSLYEQGCTRLMEAMNEAETEERKGVLRRQIASALDRAEQLKASLGHRPP